MSDVITNLHTGSVVSASASELNTLGGRSHVLTATWNYGFNVEQEHGFNTEQDIITTLAEQLAIDVDNTIINGICADYQFKGFCDIYDKKVLKEYRRRIENDYKFK